jgi:hypothetical protein
VRAIHAAARRTVPALPVLSRNATLMAPPGHYTGIDSARDLRPARARPHRQTRPAPAGAWPRPPVAARAPRPLMTTGARAVPPAASSRGDGDRIRSITTLDGLAAEAS